MTVLLDSLSLFGEDKLYFSLIIRQNIQSAIHIRRTLRNMMDYRARISQRTIIYNSRSFASASASKLLSSERIAWDSGCKLSQTVLRRQYKFRRALIKTKSTSRIEENKRWAERRWKQTAEAVVYIFCFEISMIHSTDAPKYATLARQAANWAIERDWPDPQVRTNRVQSLI